MLSDSYRRKHGMEKPRRGDVAVLSVTHPVLGTELAIGAHSIRLGPEQYLALTDELCQVAFLAPHLAHRIQALAREIGIPEISQYVVWQAERDRAAAEKLFTRSCTEQPCGGTMHAEDKTPLTRLRRSPNKLRTEEGKRENESDTTAYDGRPADAGGRNGSARGDPRAAQSHDRSRAPGASRQRLPDGARAPAAPQHAEPANGRAGHVADGPGMPG